jgi:hypothetical protein
MRGRRTTSVVIGLIGALTLSLPVHAVSVVPMTFEDLVDAATAVVYARVADVEGRWTDDRRAIESIVSLQPLRYLKGDLGDHVIVRLPGGRAGGFVNVLPGAPILRDGDLVVLFLGARGPAIPFPVGLSQGVFRVTLDPATGSTLVTPPPLKASTGGRIIRGAADRRALSVDAFAGEVRALAGGAR